jgi:ribosomal protein L11 methylase PrmA
VDAEAVWVARRTAAEQDWTARPLLFAGPIAAIGGHRFDIVVCNMISEELRPLLPDIRAALLAGGVAVLSGALGSEMATLQGELERVGLAVRSERRANEWCSVTVVRDAG